MAQIDLKPFLELMRRASKCRFKQVVMANHLLIQCYSVDNDSDVGMHYVLVIPKNNPAYDYSLYDYTMIISPSQMVKTYNIGHKKASEFKKEHGLKPKSMNEELYVQPRENGLEFKFLFYGADELIDTESIIVPFPVDQTNPMLENITQTLENLIDRIKPGGSCVLMDGNRLGIFRRTIESPDIYFHTIRINGKKVRIPFIKSMFQGNRSLDRFYISVQETNIENIYVYTIALEKDDIVELFCGYLQNY